MIYVFYLFLIFICCPIKALVQRAHLDDNWYPHNATILQQTITSLTHKAASDYNAQLNHAAIRAIIVPHAGYTYSGTVATGVYRLLDTKAITKVIILAPDHSVSFNGIALPIFDSYQTPLGSITIDRTIVDALERNP